MDKSEVLLRLHDLAPQLLGLGIVRCALFGSFVRNTATESSDLDLLVEFAPAQKNFSNFMQVNELLEFCFGRPVDLVTKESLSPFIGPHILEEAEDVPLHT
jgi:predicted nucleotidyltransferase